MKLSRALLSHLPVSIEIGGRKARTVISVFDHMIPRRSSGVSEICFDGLTFSLSTTNPSERLLMYCGPSVLRHYRRSSLGQYLNAHASSETVFLDIGANLGFYSLLAQEAGAKTVLFEPEPEHFDFLERNARFYGSVYRIALSDATGQAEFHVSAQHNPGASSLRGAPSNPLYAKTIAVRTSRLDELPDEAVADATLVKIDVEGAEELVVRGMKGLLDNGWRPNIWCEVRGPKSDRAPSSYASVVDLIKQHGYAVYAPHGSKLIPFTTMNESQVPQVFDLFFAPTQGE